MPPDTSLLNHAAPVLDLAARSLCGAMLGLIAGSFLATLVHRWPEGRSIADGRSRCDQCNATLTARELVPLASYALQRGQCRRCDGPIDRLHPVIELLGGIIGFVSTALHPGWGGLAGALFGWLLLALAALDLRHLWLPDRLTLPLLLFGLAVGYAGAPPPLLDRAIGAAAAYIFLASVAFLYHHLRGRIGIGGGDPKLFGAIGGWLGWQSLPIVLLTASIGGLLIALLMHLAGKRIDAARQMPFGAFLSAAAWMTWALQGAIW